METAELSGAAFWRSSAVVAPGAELPAEAAGLPGDLGAVLFRTSGTSGEPRWIVHSRGTLEASAAAVNRHLGVDASSCWGLALPIHHVGGFGVLARVADSACRLAEFRGSWDPATFAGWLAEAGVSHLSLVPTQVHDLVAAGLRAPATLAAVVVGGGRLERSLGTAARALGWPVLASYGLTEAGSQVATQARADAGFEPDRLELLDHWRVRTSADGRIELSGPALFLGTLGPRGLALRSGDWFRSGDLGELEGRTLRVTGRADQQVKILGELVDPQHVEQAIGVAGLVVVALPDPRAGARLVGVHRGLTPRELGQVADANSQLPGIQRLTEIIEVPEIPRGALGKVRRGELARQLAKKDNRGLNSAAGED